MNMIRHYDKRVEIVLSRNPITVVNGLNYQDSDLGTGKVQRTRTGVIQYTVHYKECLSGGGR